MNCKACLEEGISPPRPAKAKELCPMHYKRLSRNGSTEALRAKSLEDSEQLTVRLPGATVRVLRRTAKREKVSVAEVIRRAVEA